MRRGLLFLVAGLSAGAGLALPSGAGAATSATFRTQVLPGAGGAEPSLVVDTGSGSGEIYVSAIGPGPNLWHSGDGGATWSAPTKFDIDGPTSDEDADVSVAPDGTVAVADLNISHTWVQTSTDHGVTFSKGTPTGYEADRPWISAYGSDLYVAYHDFASESILICHSPDEGVVFEPCTVAYGPQTPNVPANCFNNTDIGRALRIDPTDGSLNIVFSCSTAAQNAGTPPYGAVHDYFISKSTDGGISWATTNIYTADTSNGKSPSLSNFWTSFAIDSAGNYYALMDGTMDDNDVAHNPYHVWLVTSHDHGATWGAPVIVDREADGAGTHVLSDIAVTAAGQADIIYYATPVTGEPNGVCGDFVTSQVKGPQPCPNSEGLPDNSSATAPPWHVEMAQSTDALAASPQFTYSALTDTPTHYGEICTNGIVCGASDRSLLDYISVGVDCSGAAHAAYAGNPDEQNGQKPQVYESDQLTGDLLAPPAGCAPAGGTVAEAPLAPALPAAAVMGTALAAILARRRRLSRSAA